MRAKGGGEGRRGWPRSPCLSVGIQSLYYCISLSQRLAEKVTVDIHSTWNFLSAPPFLQTKQPPGCPTFEDGDFRSEELYQFIASEAKVAKLHFLLK